MRKSVLVTRPLIQAREFAAEIEKKGFIPLIQPLLQIEPIALSYHNIKKPDALLVTSIHGLGNTPPPQDWLEIPVFTVGMTTAKTVSQAGFRIVYAGHSDIAEIIPFIREKMRQNAHILYLRGDTIKQDMTPILYDFEITEKITYAAKSIDEIEVKILDSFDEIGFLTLFSERSGHILKNLIQKYSLFSHLQSIKLLCLSRAVLESVEELGWQSYHVAGSPSTQSMIETLERIKDE